MTGMTGRGSGVLRVIAALVPASERGPWRREWEAELAYHARSGAPTAGWLVSRLRAALQHALWLRWQSLRFDSVGSDLRLAARSLAHRPGFTAAAVLTLALGIGGNTVIFSAMRAVFWRPLPYPAPQELVMVSATTPSAPNAASPNSVSAPDFVDWRQQATVFADLAVIRDDSYALTSGSGPATQISGSAVTGGFFPIFRTAAAVGRALDYQDDAMTASRVVVISAGLWRTRFGADPGLVGRQITLDGAAVDVVGIMPAGFNYPLGTDVWVPLRFGVQDLTTQRGGHYLTAVGRLKRPDLLPQARVEMSVIAARLAVAYPRTNHNAQASVVSLRAAIVGDTVDTAMRLLFGAAGLVLLVACVNVASLVLGAALGRSRDLAVRAALGASRTRLVRGLLAESVVLASAGGVIGVGLALFGARVLAGLDSAGIPLLDQARIDPQALAFAAAATAASAVLFGVLPAWQASGRDASATLAISSTRATGSAGRTRLRSLLVTAEIALAVALFVGAGLLARSFWSLTRVNLGFDTARVQTFSLSLPASYRDLERRTLFVDDLLARIDARPDVQSSGAVFGLPLSDFNYSISLFSRDNVPIDTVSERRLNVQIRVVTPAYFRTMGIPLVRGRGVEAADRFTTPHVMALNSSAARLIWPGEDAIGHQMVIGTRLGMKDRVGGEVVGIVADSRDFGPSSRPQPTAYLSYAQVPVNFMAIVVKARQESVALAEPMRAMLASIDPSLPAFRMRTMDRFLDNAVAEPRLYLQLIGLFAVTGVLLAAIGIYGVMAQNVGARTREIGIRMALGATRTGVIRLVVGHAGLMSVIGVAAGFAVAMVARRAMTKILFGVQPLDVTTYVAVGLATLAVALAAAWLPARRAAMVDPVRALRAD
jgi:predicted permease